MGRGFSRSVADLRCIQVAVSLRLPTIGSSCTWKSNTILDTLESSGFVVLLHVRAVLLRIITSLSLLFRSASLLCMRAARFPVSPTSRIVCRQPLRMFPTFFPARPVTKFPLSPVLHDCEHTTDSDRAESILLARTTRKTIRISNC